MNEIINKILLAGDKFMPEMHLSQPGFTYKACGPLIKNKERSRKFQETEYSRHIFIKTNKTKLALNIAWLMNIFRI